MSLGINTTTSEGIVLASDSRQSYRNQKGASRIGSDSASKIFQLGPSVGAVVAGLAFLTTTSGPRSIGNFINDFRDSIDKDVATMTVKDISESLKKFFQEKYKYKEQLDNLPNQIKVELEKQGATDFNFETKDDQIIFTFKDSNGKPQKGVAGVDKLQFIVAGYNPDDSHQACMVYVPGHLEVKRDSKIKNKEYGASWIGQTDVLSRIILGFDGRIGNLPVIANGVKSMGEEEVKNQLRLLEYVIQWGTMTLQDGIDFSSLAIKTTTAIQRFSDGIKAAPGDIPGVGGPVDVAVITPKHGFVWVSKKNLEVNGKVVNLDEITKTK